VTINNSLREFIAKELAPVTRQNNEIARRLEASLLNAYPELGNTASRTVPDGEPAPPTYDEFAGQLTQAIELYIDCEDGSAARSGDSFGHAA
jgi:hypothetical protein